jgi:acetyl-CoA acyltransferase
MREAVIIDCLRTAVGKAPKGTLRTTRPDDMAAAVIKALLEQSTTSSWDAPCLKPNPG